MQTALVALFRGTAGPLGIADVQAVVPAASRRTLQRLLARMVEEGWLVREGAGRAVTYRRASAAVSIARAPERAVDGGVQASAPSSGPFVGIPLAPDADEVLSYIRRPLAERQPVGYPWDWLDNYDPEHAPCLSPSVRQRLHRLGDTGMQGLPAGTYGREVLQRLLIDLSWASSRLEGNTYTRLDTRELVAFGRAATGRDASEMQMILNHKAAIEVLVDGAAELELTPTLLRGMHGLLLENLLPDRADEGRWRQRTVQIGGSIYRPPDVPSLLEEGVHRLFVRVQQCEDPFERSFLLLSHIPWLQPFADGNKRTGRVLANLPLLAANLCPITFVDVPRDAYALAMLGLYETGRTELLRDLYLWAYERSTREFLAIRDRVAEPDALRLAWRNSLRTWVARVVREEEVDAVTLVDRLIQEDVPADQRAQVRDLLLDELRRLHEGTLMRYGLRISEFMAWTSRRPGSAL